MEEGRAEEGHDFFFRPSSKKARGRRRKDNNFRRRVKNEAGEGQEGVISELAPRRMVKNRVKFVNFFPQCMPYARDCK